MSPKYALPCTCGNTAPVEARQAGETVHCQACGAMIDVPKLRELRQLDELEATQSPPRRRWSRLQGNLFVCGLMAMVIAAGAASYTFAYRLRFDASRPDPSTFEFQYDMMEIPLVDSWQLWQDFEKKKIESRPTPYHVLARQKVRELDRWLTFYAVLAVAGLLSVLACLVTRPTS